MWTGFSIFKDMKFRTWEQLRMVLKETLGDLDAMSDKTSMGATAGAIAEALGDDEDYDDEDFDDSADLDDDPDHDGDDFDDSEDLA